MPTLAEHDTRIAVLEQRHEDTDTKLAALKDVPADVSELKTNMRWVVRRLGGPPDGTPPEPPERADEVTITKGEVSSLFRLARWVIGGLFALGGWVVGLIHLAR